MTNQYTITITQEDREVFKLVINCTEKEGRQLAKMIIEGDYKLRKD